MNVSPGLIAKAAAGTAAVAASSAGIAYKNEISRILFGEDVSALNEKLENLGLPGNCRFEGGKIEKDCGTLTSNVLKAINFDGKTGEPTITWISGARGKLKIRRDGDGDIFPDGIKIIFEIKNDLTISEGLNANWKLGTSPEYKIKEENSTIVNAWTLEDLAKRINLIYESGSDKCNFGSTINVFEDDSNNVIGATISGNNSNKKIKIEKDQEGHNQGFKLTVDEDIQLTGGTKKGQLDKIEKSNGTNVSYEIKEHEVDGQKHWFLSKVNSTTQR